MNDDLAPSLDELLGFCDAAGLGDVAAVNVFIDQYPEVVVGQKKDWGEKALGMAAQEGQKYIVELLLTRGVSSLGAKNAAGLWAASKGQKAIVELLLEEGASIDALPRGGCTMLMQAVWNGHTDVVNLLLEKGADIDKKTDMGWTALACARSGGDRQMIDILEQWAEQKRQALTEQAAAVLAAEKLKKLQKARPAKPVLKRRFP